MKSINPILLFAMLTIIAMSCKQTDDMPPVITLNGSDSVNHILNTVYNDAGATATDEFEGNVSTKIFIDNTVNENLVGEYVITYSVIDEAGNEAAPAHRWVFVYNTAWKFIGDYSLTENQVYPEPVQCDYEISIYTDSILNNRIIFTNLNCDFGQHVYADLDDTLIIMPFQEISDTISKFQIQGSGYTTDSTIFLDYTKTDTISSLWEADFEKQ